MVTFFILYRDWIEIYSFVCCLSRGSISGFGADGLKQAARISVDASFWLSFRVKQKHPIQKPTKDDTSNNINKSCIFTGIVRST